MAKKDFFPKKELQRAMQRLMDTDNVIHEIIFQLDLEYGPNSSSDLAVTLISLERTIGEAIKEGNEYLRKCRGKLALNLSKTARR